MYKVLEGRSYRLQHPWVGIVNRSQAEINRNADMMAARHKEREYFATSPDYSHLASRMGSEYLAKILSKVNSLGHSLIVTSFFYLFVFAFTKYLFFLSFHSIWSL